MNTQNYTLFLLAATQHKVGKTDQLHNISEHDFLSKLKQCEFGEKDGSHYLRTTLRCQDGRTLPRKDSNTDNLANILILDCDKHINLNGDEIEGAPSPKIISPILRSNNISHIIYGSYSHYVGNKGNRYRIILFTNIPYNRDQLAPTVEKAITLINSHLNDQLLANAKENNTWSQPWYFPRKPINSIIDDLYIEYLDGEPIDVTSLLPASPQLQPDRRINYDMGRLSPIDAFNDQNPLHDLLAHYSYKKVYKSKDYEKWIRPDSSSGNAGIIVDSDKFYSFHNDQFNDGKRHDAFDLMMKHEGLSLRDAVSKAAKNSIAPDGRTIDEYNKSIKKKVNTSNSTVHHNEVLNQLLGKIEPINFREIAKLSEKEKIKYNHYHVITIETILALAKDNNWGICRNHDFIYVYNGTHWHVLEEDELKSFLGKAAEKMGVDEHIARHFNFKDQLLKQFIASGHLPKPNNHKNNVLINLKNGTFMITPLCIELKPFDRNNFMTYQLPFDHDEKATAPQFMRYLNKVLPDTQLQNILSEYIGYVFIRSSTLKLEKVLLLYGAGANGKSVFYEIIRSLLGEQNISEYSLQTLTNESGYQRAMIANKLMNYASEINGKLGASIFKQLASGEPVEARLPYGRPFSITDYAKLIFNCNELPRDVEHTEAHFRRFLIIPFNVTIPEHEQDKELAAKIISSELSGVFNWVLDGLTRLLKQKRFTHSNAVDDARKQYEKESDSVKLFIEENEYQKSTEKFVALVELYFQYKTYCQDNCYTPFNNTNFRRRLEAQKIILTKKNFGKVVYITKINRTDSSAYKDASE